MKDPIRIRHLRKPFLLREGGPYRLPESLASRLTALLMPYQNRVAALALAAFIVRRNIGRKISVHDTGIFFVARRRLAKPRNLGLSENTVRGGIATLEKIGFLVRARPPGTKAYPRKGVPYFFGTEYAALLSKPAPEA